ncbi:ABC transporter permease [Dichelobacter nodosus]|uniref:ABC transporter family protein n=1 Tax=Dichelobacter nodosus (strain VCS1703A) TaxID=246195 RepID=A5EVS9_DICNV|nr:ABC transporter permease subunit [Dichelobacter nodosus]ABQ13441.1 ABC transporter family protein [Dichelobacter nodosus VCS1703A]AXM45339.1 ABC transporter permease subunit [Dichelobacter nodosus]KNZ40049.1 oligopeptide transporter permease [Dichelobacter nodosus]TGA65047.1 ABC transporter permease subunit [Dichelobacter nodosus]
MFRYMLRRLCTAVPTLLVIVTLAFFMIRLAPGGPFDLERNLPPEIQANLQAMYHLDEPLWRQYLIYLSHVMRGDLGASFQYADRSVNELIAFGFPVSMKLGAAAMTLATILGTFFGIFAALHHKRAGDYFVMGIAMIGITVPNFVVGSLLLLVCAVLPFVYWGLTIVPASGWGEHWRQMILPTITLALPQMAYIARLMRASMLEVLQEPHIKTARAKGLTERQVIVHHCLKPALMPVISYLAPALASVLTGSIVIEQLFAIPGIGRYFVNGALNRDYTLVLGVVILYGALVIFLNLLVDLAYAWLNPKVRWQ